MPTAEAQRIAALHEYDLLDRPAGDELEAVVRVAAVVAGVPTATLNLLDENRQCQLTTVGFTGGDSSRADSMCAVRFLEGRTVYLPDASRHPDYTENPWVTGRFAQVRFYLSVPLITADRHALGTLCVFDDQRRELTEQQVRRLEDLGTVLVALFERRREARRSAMLAAESDRQRRLTVDQRRELEVAHSQLTQRGRELERSNAELEHFATVASHDLRSPLAVIDGYLDLLVDLYGDRLDDRAREWITIVRTAVGRMLGLTDALLSYAQVGAGSCTRDQVDIAAAFEAVLVDLRTQIEATGARVSATEHLPTVPGDPALLRQLLQNLVSNAVRHRDESRGCEIRLDSERSRAGWTFAVTDNGHGIPADQRERVFGMFARLDPSAKTGHGVGLATCQRIVDRHGGRIWIDETPGGGATVRFTIPAAID